VARFAGVLQILRGTMRKIADAQEYQVPSTIDDPAILDEIGSALDLRRGQPAGSG
jgi:propionyl-CoA synthetase